MLPRTVGIAAAVAGLGGLVLVSVGCGTSTESKLSASTPTVARPSAHRPQSVPALVARVRSGILKIEILTCEGGGVGSGFLLSPRLVATVEHVVDRAQAIRLKQSGKVVATATVIGQDAERDVALLRTDRPIAGQRRSTA